MIDEAETEYGGEQELTRAQLEKLGKDWLERIDEAETREDDWRKAAEAAEAAYLCDEKSEHGFVPDFNILHSNVETIVPAIYNSTPAPDVRPRHNTPDEIAKLVADIYERAIAAQIDDDKLDTEVEGAAQDAFLAGRGGVRIRFDADVDEMGQVTDERLIFENVSWRDYREGPAKRHADLPWMAFRHTVTMKELGRISDDALMERQADPTDNVSLEAEDVDIWEIWCRETKTVKFIDADTGKVLSIRDDPLGLKHFFPMPQPVQPITATGSRKPVCPYAVYKTLAEELDRITRRINAIMKGLKVRGIIPMAADGLERLAAAGDNELVPIANIENLAVTGGLEKAVMWWPIEQAINVLRELYAQREQTKQAIYEITGISDIVRGATDPRETRGAQEIKTQWGSLRIKRMQRMIARHVRDLFVLSAEIMAKHFSPQSLAEMAGVQLPMDDPEAMARILPMLSGPLAHYRIDVESDSTVRADLTQRKGEMSEFLNGTAQFFSTMAPVVAQSPQAAEPMAEMYAAFARQFSLGKQAEDAIDKLAKMAKDQATQGEKPDPKEQAEMAKMQLEQAEQQFQQQFKGAELQWEQQKWAQESQFKAQELALKEREIEIKEAELGLKGKQAEFGAIKDAAEFEMEADQERPVRVGDGDVRI